MRAYIYEGRISCARAEMERLILMSRFIVYR